MKKIMFLAVLMFVAAILSCNLAVNYHEHTFEDAWTFDLENHWHKSTCEHPDVFMGVSPHNWNEGQEIKPATSEDTGLKTYTCRVCKKTKTEVIPALPLVMTFEEFMNIARDALSITAHDFKSGIISQADGRVINAYNVKLTGKYSGHFYDMEYADLTGIDFSEVTGSNNIFDHCYELKEVVLPENMNSISFCSCENLKKVNIPSSVTTIPDACFNRCYYIHDVKIPDSVTSIGDSAFSECSGFDNFIIPDSVTSIGNCLFTNCVKNLVIGLGVQRIGSELLAYCDKLTIKDINKWVMIDIDENNFIYGGRLTVYLNEKKLTDLNLDSSVTQIKPYTLRGFNFETVIIPDSVTEIGNNALESCLAKKLVIGTGVKKIGSFNFMNSDIAVIKDLNKWVMIDFVDEFSNPLQFAKKIYLNDEELTDIVLDSSVTEIKPYAFYDWKNINSITVPNNVKIIGENAFANIPKVIYSGTATGAPWGAKSVVAE